MKSAFLSPVGLCILAASITVAAVWPHVPGLARLTVPSAWLLFWGCAGFIAASVVQAWPLAGRDGSPATGTSDDDFAWSADAIASQIRAESLQQPMTLIPLTGATLILVHAFLLAPQDTRLWEFFLGGVGLVLAAGAFLWTGVIRYSERQQARIAEVMNQIDMERTRRDAADIERLRQRLEDGFSITKATGAAASLRRLKSAFLQLNQVLQDHRTSDPLSLKVVPGLARETYRRGLSVLDDVLELLSLKEGFDGAELRSEIEELERHSDSEDGGSEWRALHEQRLALYRRRLDGHERLNLDVDRLLYQADRCEASLYEARLHLAAIRTGMSEESLASVTEALRRTVEQARETQDELRRLAH